MRLILLAAAFLFALLICTAPVRSQPLQAEAPSRLQAEPPPRLILPLRTQILHHPATMPETPPTAVPIHLALSLKEEEDDDGTSAWAYVAGGVLLAHGILAAVLLGMDENGPSGGDDGNGFPQPPGRPE